MSGKKLNSLQKVKDNQCKLVFKLPEEKSTISFFYLISPFVVIFLGISLVVAIHYVVNKLSESSQQREDEQMLRKPKAIL